MKNYNANTIEEIEGKKSLIFKFKLFFKQIKENEFLKNEIVFWLLILNFVANISNWIILFIFMNKVDGDVILHYNVYFGVDNIGSWKKSFIMPFIGIIIFSLNVFLAAFFYKNKERIASYILLLSVLMAQMGLIIASVSIILINY